VVQNLDVKSFADLYELLVDPDVLVTRRGVS
jgi:hypothetical protein